MSTLYIVSTPIGNLEDITFRALRVLKEADVIFCEDTRVTRKLLEHYKINPPDGREGKPLKSFHAHSLIPSTQYMASFSNIAYVTDAGTPGISDPGAKLVALARESGMSIVPIPGPSALTALLSVAGKEIKEFIFKGFPPHKKGRETFFREVAKEAFGDMNSKCVGRPVIFYEAPTRVLKALTFLDKFCPDNKIVIGRELTKKFEEVLEGTASELLVILTTNPLKQKGEFAILVIP